MIVSGIVVTVRQGGEASRIAEALAGTSFEIGPASGRRLPIVIESQSQDEARRAIERLDSHADIEYVDVTFVGDDGGRDGT